MGLDYPDWSFPNWLLDQSAELYVADVFAKRFEPTYEELKTSIT